MYNHAEVGGGGSRGMPPNRGRGDPGVCPPIEVGGIQGYAPQ